MSRLVQLTPGSVFAGEFRVVRPLAEGGMGAVYEVEQVGTGASRALKIMHPQLVGDGKLRARFIQEARVSALIKSDHVVQVVGAGVDADTGTPWLAMELLEGETLASLLARRGALSLLEVREIFSQLCHALGAAHDVGVVHRDLKPENIFLAFARREGVAFTVKVLDFGIAKLVAEAQTHHTAAIGTPLWMAPEQTEVGSAVAPATDVWALGLLAFHALTGFHYWRTANSERLSAASLLREVVLEPLASASERAAAYGRADRIPPGFDDWFGRCVVREIERRFPRARDARDAFEQVVAIASTGPLPTSGASHLVAPTSVVIASAPESAEAIARSATVLVTPAPNDPGAPRGTGDPVTADDDERTPVPVRPFPVAIVAAVAVVALAVVGIVASKLGGGASAAPAPSQEPAPPGSGSSIVLDPPPILACPPGMASIGGGTFFMSSRGDHVTVQPFCIDATEVTVADYDACVKKGLCTETGLTAEPLCNWSSRAKKGKHPINCVDWDQAASYCHAIAKRLPTMAEWEWTSRNGDKGTTYPWGDDPPGDHLCWSGSLDRMTLGTCEAGSHASGASKFGVSDLAGNVAEWVAEGENTHDSVRPLLGDHWQSKTATFQKDLSGRTSVATRLAARTLHQATIGFRCAETP